MTGDDEDSIAEMKLELIKTFTIKDLGLLRYFQGIEVSRSENGTIISQRKYAMDIVQDTGMDNCMLCAFHFPK